MSDEKRLTFRVKLSKQQKLILELLSLHDGKFRQRELTKLVAEKLGRIKHFSKQDAIDHGIKAIREASDERERGLLSLIITDHTRRMPRQGYTYVLEGCRASVSRSLKRLQLRGLINKTVLGDVILSKQREPGGFLATCPACAYSEFDILDWHYKGSNVMRLKWMNCGVQVAYDPKMPWMEYDKWNVLFLDKETGEVLAL